MARERWMERLEGGRRREVERQEERERGDRRNVLIKTEYMIELNSL